MSEKLTKLEQKDIQRFFDRNQDYIKYADVPQELIDKYTGVLPEPILEVWRRTGFGIYEHGFVQFVNPDEWEFVFDYIDLINDPVVVIGITALGDLITWEGKGAGGQGNHINVVFVNDCDDDVVGGTDPAFWLGYDFDVNMEDETHEDFHYNVKEYRSKNYQKIKRVLPPLKYGECYGYTPIPALGGKKSYKTLQVVDAKTYVDMIGQATGKIIDLS
ncbi:GAD-like domain-containing protein [Capnocytophaga canimorsus]|uniref:GAD-like domain-containing protein n=1 Tax=Capnocytophaga canimorsus TaxID=28188 RepID=UPI001561BB88|nr:GAD-like domain-containing protein [Capnocytophaga canimorsus]